MEAFVDFLGRDRNFVYLIQREPLGDGSRVAEFLGRLVDDAVGTFTPAAELMGVSPQRLVLDLVALCWYPFAHEHTLVPALGMKPRDPAFLEEQKRHLGDLVRALARRSRAQVREVVQRHESDRPTHVRLTRRPGAEGDRHAGGRR